RVINAALRAGVQRLVLTSSTLSMVAGRPSGRYGTDAWSDLNADIGAYAKSKTLAERSAWEQVTKSNLELVVINPGAVYGPSLGAEVDGQSVAFIKDLIRGKVPMIPNVAMGMVDVRDVARLHAVALTTASAAGRRFIAATSEPIRMSHVAETLRNAGYKKVPSRKAPNVAIKLMSLFDREAKGMLPLLNLSHSFDNHATFDVLKWIPTPIEVSLREMAASL
ncbi:MAG: NAD-dependent epimerase/dehydratase family protein, partial [Actinobacteria bacterium]|nr:NAD-dependent epimerase/dehydratase family protein [Actinomycetota bacterium]